MQLADLLADLRSSRSGGTSTGVAKTAGSRREARTQLYPVSQRSGPQSSQATDGKRLILFASGILMTHTHQENRVGREEFGW
jgi:hypothetical protein